MERIFLKDVKVGDLVRVIYRDNSYVVDVDSRWLAMISRVEDKSVDLDKVTLQPLLPRPDGRGYSPYFEFTSHGRAAWKEAYKFTEEEAREAILAFELQR